jgi:thiamine biosynthesis lipoprotein
VAEECFALVERLGAVFTTHDPASATSRLNARAGEPPAPVPSELAAILRDAAAFARTTRGAFDPTVGPLVALWSEAGRAGKAPSDAALAAARARVGAAGIVVADDGRAGLARPGMALDLGGLAKGWALDRVRERLAERGVRAAFASFGESSLLALGQPPDARGWRVLVRGPGGGLAGVAELRDASLSVSESLGQTTQIEGRRYGHVIDPRSGRPLAREALAVVRAPSGGLAEALSKALLVLPADEAFALLEELPGVEGLLLEAGRPPRTSAGFAAALDFRPLGPEEPAG